jgi:hypothetical protein
MRLLGDVYVAAIDIVNARNGLINYNAHSVDPFNYVAKKGFRGVKFGRVKNLGGVLLLSRW